MITDDTIRAAWDRHEGNVTAMARELKLPRATLWSRVEKLKLRQTKPLSGGSINGVPLIELPLPAKGKVTRYICTSAQNNTKIFQPLWTNLTALAKHHNARILVGTFSYNQNAFGKLAVKRGTAKHDKDLWYAKEIEPFISDQRLQLGRSLVWCGEMNIQPTAVDPLSGLETYSGRYSAIFPHAMIAMRSIAAMKGDAAKLNYTTGTVTQKNYIQKKAGLKGEHQHSYGAVIVEIDHAGSFWVRQVESSDDGTIYDLGVQVKNGQVTTGHRVEAITWGDIHASQIDPTVHEAAVGEGKMLDVLLPRHQFLHDLLNGSSVNHHEANDPHRRFELYCKRGDEVQGELDLTFGVMAAYLRHDVKTVVVNSNHDDWFAKWLRESDYRRDPKNAILFLEAQLAVYQSIQKDQKLNLLEWAMHRWNEGPNGRSLANAVMFLQADQSYRICDGVIECGMHGHLGSNGSRGTPQNLYSVGRRANTGHTHSTGIYHGLYVAGTSCLLDSGYNRGVSSWTHSHVVTYENGKRSIIGVYGGKWRA